MMRLLLLLATAIAINAVPVHVLQPFNLTERGSFYSTGVLNNKLLQPENVTLPQVPVFIAVDTINQRIWLNLSSSGYRLFLNNGTFTRLSDGDAPIGACYYTQQYTYASVLNWWSLATLQDQEGPVRTYFGQSRDVTTCTNPAALYFKTRHHKLEVFSLSATYIIGGPETIVGRLEFTNWTAGVQMDAPYWNIAPPCLVYNTSLCQRQYPNGCEQISQLDPYHDRYNCSVDGSCGSS